MEGFYATQLLPDGGDCATTLLRLLRDQLVITDYASVHPEALVASFNTPATQLQLLRGAEPVLRWKPQLGDDANSDPFPAVLELETSPFRHGPPGCEDVIRSLFCSVSETVMNWLLRDLATASEPAAEADLFVLGCVLAEVVGNKETQLLVTMAKCDNM